MLDSEDNDKPRSIYFSRKPHVPSSASGVTHGRGYDLKRRYKPTSKAEVLKVNPNAQLWRW